MCHAFVPDPLARYAREYAGSLLDGRTADLAKAEAAARQAEAASSALRGPRPEMLVAAAQLHAIGKAPGLVRTGFVPVDGAMGLMAMGWPDPVVSLVGHQTQSRLISQTLGAGPQLALIPRIQGWPSDILDYAILTAGTDGNPRTLEEGLEAFRQEQAADSRIPQKLCEARLSRLARAGYRVRDALTRE